MLASPCNDTRTANSETICIGRNSYLGPYLLLQVPGLKYIILRPSEQTSCGAGLISKTKFQHQNGMPLKLHTHYISKFFIAVRTHKVIVKSVEKKILHITIQCKYYIFFIRSFTETSSRITHTVCPMFHMGRVEPFKMDQQLYCILNEYERNTV
jgi:hypothetical protein